MQHFIRLPEVMLRTGLSRASIYSEIAAGRFPKQVKLTPGSDPKRAVGWIDAEVDDWIGTRIASRDKTVEKKA